MLPSPSTSYHVHTTFSDGRADMETMAVAAVAKGLREIGFSDHYVRTPGRPPEPCPWSMAPDGAGDYVRAAEKVRSGHADIGVRIGLEADFFPETWETTLTTIRQLPLDYVIGSVHYVDGFPVDESAVHWSRLTGSEVNEVWRLYWIRVRQLAVAGGFDILGHADLPKKFGFRPTADLSREIGRALDALAAADVAMELNTSGLDKPCAETYPSGGILAQAASRGIPLVITADAHAPAEIARHFAEGRELAARAGYAALSSFRDRKRSPAG